MVDVLKDYNPHKTLYNYFVRWSRMEVFDRIFTSLAASEKFPESLRIKATYIKACRTAANLLKKGLFPVISTERKAA